MKPLKMHSLNLTQENIARLGDLFPHCITEKRDDHNHRQLAVDFDLLKQTLSDVLVEGQEERYQLNWPGKREALLTANTPIAKTLRPNRQDSVDFDTTQNLFIEGDNLEALKLLQETYLGKVKMIYIDPPYNTGKDFIYNDNYTENTEDFLKRSHQKDEAGHHLVANPESNGRFHSDWLSMIYPRLKLARNLLRDDGVIFIHIDENEYPNLEKILSEIYGESNNLGTIIWDKRNPKGDAIGVAQQHELISIYCKNREHFKVADTLKKPKENSQKMIDKVQQFISVEKEINENVRKKYKDWLSQQDFSGGERAYNLIDDLGEIYRPVSMAWPNKQKAPDDYFIPLIHPKTNKVCPLPERGWRNPPETMKNLLKRNLILFGQDESTQPTRKYLLKENLFENVPSLLYFAGSDDALFKEWNLFFDNPKPVVVSKKLIQSICKTDDLILDFFAGSATTAHAVMQLNAEDGGNRKFIMVQIPETCKPDSEAFKAGYKNIAEISKERIRRAGKKIIEGACHEAWKKDIGFRVLTIDTSNMLDVYYAPQQIDQTQLHLLTDHIKPNRTDEDLLFQVLVDWGIDLSLPIESTTILNKHVLMVDKNAIIACFDKDINDDFVKALAHVSPDRVVFRDTGFASDAVKINVEQLFKQLSPSTEIRVI